VVISPISVYDIYFHKPFYLMSDLTAWQQLFCPPATPIIALATVNAVQIYVKRDDLNHPIIQGNKLRKLKYNLKQALINDYSAVATFGGAWSNHIVATAQAAQLCGMQSHGFIRGDELQHKHSSWSKTLTDAQAFGMQLIFLSRCQYRQKLNSWVVKEYLQNLSKLPYLIPEGGSNQLALKGVAELVSELKQQLTQPSHIITACGTGGTMAGLIDGVKTVAWRTAVIGIPVLKGAQYLATEIMGLSTYQQQINWQLYHDYHGGGYAKLNDDIINFASDFYAKNNIALDKIYTAKAFYAAYDLIKEGVFSKGDRLLLLHTGGLQGGIIY
jgi:1-aminocyclopropane-1-carboxylate deaminase